MQHQRGTYPGANFIKEYSTNLTHSTQVITRMVYCRSFGDGCVECVGLNCDFVGG